MIDLYEISGLPMSLDLGGGVVFDQGVVVDESKVRRVNELESVADDPDACKGDERIAYYMYNGVYHQRDVETIRRSGMRYELTLLVQGVMGKECVKTMGHRHFPEPSSGLEYVEICEVLYGTAHFFFQMPVKDGVTHAAFMVEAKAGEKVIFPPVMDHCTINAGNGPMLFSDVITLGVNGNYAPFKEFGGGAYLEICGGDGIHEIVQNPRFREIPPLQWVTPGEYPELDIAKVEPLYTAYVRTGGAKWNFLANPALFDEFFPDLKRQFKL